MSCPIHVFRLCMSPSHVIWHGPVSDTAACCAKCAATAGCVGWTHQNGTMAAALGTSPCFICNVTKGGPNPGRTSGCVGDVLGALTFFWAVSDSVHHHPTRHPLHTRPTPHAPRPTPHAPRLQHPARARTARYALLFSFFFFVLVSTFRRMLNELRLAI